MSKLSDELKAAIKELPEKEKDKLLLRLIPKSNLLVQQLEFQLLEGGTTALVRREELKDKIQKEIDQFGRYYNGPGMLMMDMRSISGDINLHVSVTKDKLAEIELNLLMIEGLLNKNHAKLKEASYHNMLKFNEYLIKRMIKVMKLLEKIHEDYHSDYRVSINSIGRLMFQIPTLTTSAIYMKFDIRVLQNF